MTIEALALDLEKVLGSGGVLTGSANTKAFAEEESGRFFARPPDLVLRPRTEAQLSDALQLLAGIGVDYVLTLRSGGTSLKGGCVPVAGLPGDPLRVSVDFSRLTAISIDAATRRVFAAAGCTLDAVDKAAATMNPSRAFGVIIGPQDIAMVGGSIAIGKTSGPRAARYGSIADQIPRDGAGLRAMLVDGTVVTSPADLPAGLRDRSLKELFCGTEGAFGIVLSAAFDTWPRLMHRSVAILDVESVALAVRIAELLHPQTLIESLELMRGANMTLVCQEGGLPKPRTTSPWKLLVEAAAGYNPTEELQDIIGSLLDAGLITDADGPSENEPDRKSRWLYRKWYPLACGNYTPVLRFDARIRYEAYPQFVEGATQLIQGICPGATVVIFGHLLGSNVHIDVLGATEDDFEAIEDAVYGRLLEIGGEISHEHGYGQSLCERRWALLEPEDQQEALTAKKLLDRGWHLNRGLWVPHYLAA